MIEQVVSDLAAGSREIRPIELQIVGAQLQVEGFDRTPRLPRVGNPRTVY